MGEGRRVEKREGDGKGEEGREEEGRMSCQQLHTMHTGSPGVCITTTTQFPLWTSHLVLVDLYTLDVL